MKTRDLKLEKNMVLSDFTRNRVGKNVTHKLRGWEAIRKIYDYRIASRIGVST